MQLNAHFALIVCSLSVAFVVVTFALTAVAGALTVAAVLALHFYHFLDVHGHFSYDLDVYWLLHLHLLTHFDGHFAGNLDVHGFLYFLYDLHHDRLHCELPLH